MNRCILTETRSNLIQTFAGMQLDQSGSGRCRLFRRPHVAAFKFKVNPYLLGEEKQHVLRLNFSAYHLL